MLGAAGELTVLEANAIPGLTETSLLPQAAEVERRLRARGIGFVMRTDNLSFPEAVERLAALGARAIDLAGEARARRRLAQVRREARALHRVIPEPLRARAGREVGLDDERVVRKVDLLRRPHDPNPPDPAHPPHVLAALGRATGALEAHAAGQRRNDHTLALARLHETHDLLMTPTLGEPPIEIGAHDTPWHQRLGAHELAVREPHGRLVVEQDLVGVDGAPEVGQEGEAGAGVETPGGNGRPARPPGHNPCPPTGKLFQSRPFSG